MNRRAFLLTSAATLALPHIAQAFTVLEYTPALWDEVRATNDTVILNFRASWSLTDEIKLELIAKLIAENPDYNSLTFITVDWDTFGQSQLANRMRVTRNATLVVMKGNEEITRLVNEPYERKIRAFLDAALVA